MSIVLKDSNVDKSNLIKFRSLEVKNNLYSKSDSCFFTYSKHGSRTYVPAGGNEIGIWDGAAKIFGGKIINVKKRIEGNILVYDVECKDWVETLDKKLVTETYENQTVNAIIADIKATYATAFDITNVACTTVIEKIDFAAMPVSKCLDKLAEITGYHWYVDPDKKIYFFVEGGQSSPFDLTDDNGKYNTQSLEVEDDYAQIKNKVNIQGGSIANVQVSDATSIAAYGEHEVIIRDSKLTSTDEATQKANAVLADYKDPVKKGSFTTYEAGLKPGQQINVQSTIRSINQNFIINSVSFNARTPDDFEYTVKIMTQRDKELMEFLQNQAMQPLPAPALGNAQFSTNIKFSITNYHEISWAAGTIIMSDGKEYSIASGSQAFSGTDIIYFKPTTSETVLQFSSTLADGMGSDRIAIAYCIENSNVALGAQVIPMGYHGGIRAWGGENIVARTIIADQIGLNSLVSNLVTTGEFITLAAQIKDATITNAKIVDLNATKVTAGTMNAARINGGDINGVTITGVVVTGGTVRTSSGNKKVQMSGGNNRLEIYNATPSLIGYFGGTGNGTVIYVNQPNTYTDYPAIYVTSAEGSNVMNMFNTNSSYSNRPAFRFESNNNVSELMYLKHTANWHCLIVEANSNSYAALYIKQLGTNYLVATNVSGCYCNKAGTWQDASSKKLKENFENLTVLDKLKNLEIKKYNYIVDGKRSKQKIKEDFIIQKKREKYSKTDKGRKGGFNDEGHLKQTVSSKELLEIEEKIPEEYDEDQKKKTEKHFTPMAEEFYDMFEFGKGDGISPADLAGVALQAIKELTDKVEKLEAKLNK